MSNTVISIENVSKLYQLGNVSSQTLQGDIKRWWAQVRGREDPFSTIGTSNILSSKLDDGYVWALKDINLDINQGEVVGIIGKNGAGKSTLLKILSRVTTPTHGTIKIKGRIASLLEVGTGFHPELTGRENIFLNGSFLGMKRSEIQSKFDEIVTFAGVEKYIDTPVKRYSSGMYVRLAFAVAAHLEPEILIVDEVLAVGDAEFQNKCMGKMKEVGSQGRTVLFVSHNMGAINSLCQRAVLLQNGKLSLSGTTEHVISQYLNFADDIIKSNEFYWDPENCPGDSIAKILSFRLVDEHGAKLETISTETRFGVEITYSLKNLDKSVKPGPNFLLCTSDDVKIFHDINTRFIPKEGMHKTISWFPSGLLNDGDYKIEFAITTQNPVIIHAMIKIHFHVVDDMNSPIRNRYRGKIHGVIRFATQWQDFEM